MCEYLDINNNGRCRVKDNQCPYVYFCTKINRYRPQNNFPAKCKVAEAMEIPKGYYKVCFVKRGNLYIDYDGHVEIVANPFEDGEVPAYVRMYKVKGGAFKVKK